MEMPNDDFNTVTVGFIVLQFVNFLSVLQNPHFFY